MVTSHKNDKYVEIKMERLYRISNTQNINLQL